MRVNTAKSIETANTVYDSFGSWKAAKAAARYSNGKFLVKSGSAKKGKSAVSDKAGGTPRK
jgi:hypothetical protein